MTILLLGPPSENISSHLTDLGNQVICYEKEIMPSSKILDAVDFIVCYGYKHIVGQEIVKRFHNRAINLHISYLPWNRGSDPNLWSFLDDTPKGVSMHFIDEGIDTGCLLARQKIEPHPDDTLKTSYDRLKREIEKLFVKEWPEIFSGKKQGEPQFGKGSFHKRSDFKAVEHLLTEGWDTPIKYLVENYKKLNCEKK